MVSAVAETIFSSELNMQHSWQTVKESLVRPTNQPTNKYFAIIVETRKQNNYRSK